jgi:hypothetical protein
LSAALALFPSRISSIYSLLFSLARHPFQCSIPHTLKAIFFSSSLSLSSLLEKKDVVSKPNSKSEGKINAASQLDSQTTKQDYSWSCQLEARLFLIMLLRWSVFLFLLLTVNFSSIYSQSGDGDLWQKRKSTTIWVSHSYPFRIVCLPSSLSWFPCFHLASFPFGLPKSIFTTRKCYMKIFFLQWDK